MIDCHVSFLHTGNNFHKVCKFIPKNVDIDLNVSSSFFNFISIFNVLGTDNVSISIEKAYCNELYDFHSLYGFAACPQ